MLYVKEVQDKKAGIYKRCVGCGKPIATQASKFLYKYCLACLLKGRKESKPLIRRSYLTKTIIEHDFATGKRWLKDKCEICGYDKILEAHRIIPKRKGGTYTKDNTMTLCPNCHALITKKKMTAIEVREYLRY